MSESILDQFMVPLMTKNDISSGLPNECLPRFSALPVLDIHGKLTTFDTLTQHSEAMQNSISSCYPFNQKSLESFNPIHLLCPYPETFDQSSDKAAKPKVRRPQQKQSIPINDDSQVLPGPKPAQQPLDDDGDSNINANVIVNENENEIALPPGDSEDDDTDLPPDEAMAEDERLVPNSPVDELH